MEFPTLSLALLWPLLLGALLGGVGGLLGIGGGVIAIPVLAMGFGMSQQLAQGTALVMIMPNVLLAFWRYYQRHPMPLTTVGLLGACALVATWPAAWLAVHLDSRVLTLCFAVFLIGLAGYFLWGTRAAAPVQAAAAAGCWHSRYLPGVGIAGGFMSGLFGVGAGIVAAPLLVRGFGLRQAVAQGMGLAMVVPGSMLALATFAEARQVDWQTGALLAVGGMATISYGVAWAHRLPERKLRRLFALLLLLTAALMIVRGLAS
ncbi:MAG: sulfite exporter TauE/SafE family protein [Rhodocyclales bacterium]|nr:sulfite exporter TauE/SafE family protein [Rhodocyclales bacterium]